MVSHEEAIVQAFIRPDRRGRWLAQLATQAGREKLRRQLAHCEDDLDPRYARQLAGAEQTDARLRDLVSRQGRFQQRHVWSESDSLDGRLLSIDGASDQIIGSVLAAFLSVEIGRFAYFEAESMGSRWLLERAEPLRR